jgi:hypothetical protein
MRLRAALTMLLLLIVVQSTHWHTGIYFEQQSMIVSPILSFEIITKSPRIYASYKHEGGSPVMTSILRRSWNYDRKERHPTRYMLPGKAEASSS